MVLRLPIRTLPRASLARNESNCWITNNLHKLQRGSVCETDEDCYADVMRHRFIWAEPEDVTDIALSHPGEYTAAVVFDMPTSDTAPIDSFTLQVRFWPASRLADGFRTCACMRIVSDFLIANRSVSLSNECG